MKNDRTALFVARLQPLHKGHLHAIKSIMRKYGKIVVAIGSAQESRTARNPFSFSERKEMIQAVLRKEGIRAKIIGVKDFHNDVKWARSIERRCKFDLVVTGNSWTRRCFKRKYMVTGSDLLQPKKYSATRIRKMMANGKEWKSLVPKQVYDYIKRMRLK